MADSEEEEFFQATQLPEKKTTDVSDRKSVVEYFFIVSFNWDLMVGSPFEINVLEVLKDIPENWIYGPLSKDDRKSKIPLKALGSGDYSVFCKIEKGSIYL